MLRVLQDGTFERIGGTETLKVNVRILAATNRDLAALMREGTFRDDLYYRLKVVPIHLPPLRERGDDVVLLAEYFLHQSRDQLARASLAFSDEAAKLLHVYHWPGNVRELKNVVQGAAPVEDTCFNKEIEGRTGSTMSVSLAVSVPPTISAVTAPLVLT